MECVEPSERRVDKFNAGHALSAMAAHDEVILAAIDRYSRRSPSRAVEDLRGRTHEATIQLERASAEFANVARQPSGEDHGERLESADRALATARQELLQTLTEFNLFLLEGAIQRDSRKPIVFANGDDSATVVKRNRNDVQMH